MSIERLIAEGLEKGFIVLDGDGYVWDPGLSIPQTLGFEDVSFLQKKNQCRSRLDVSIRSEVARGLYLEVPLIAANMSTVTNASFCNKLRGLGALGVLHRAWSNEEDYLREVALLSMWSNSPLVAASVGAGPSQVELSKKLIQHGANILVIDIAHGYSDAVKETAAAIRKYSRETILIVGNTNNVDMLYEFDDLVDGVKVGLANGLACRTKHKTGSFEPQFSSVLKFKSAARRLGMPIISDGGVRQASDVSKAIGAGANSVMIGSLFAACPESAAPVVEGKRLYAGMSSAWVQDRWRGGLKPGTCAEGTVVMLEPGPPVAELIEDLAGALRSGITYAGATDINTFQERVEFVRV